MLGIVLALAMIVLCAYLFELLEGLVGTQCPNCRQRELEWRTGTWKYGDPPDYRYFECASCGARFRQLCGGQGVLSEFERVEERAGNNLPTRNAKRPPREPNGSAPEGPWSISHGRVAPGIETAHPPRTKAPQGRP